MKAEHFQIFFEKSINLCSIASPEGYFVEVNQSFVDVLGYSKEELLSRPFLDFVHQEDRPKTSEETDSFGTTVRVEGFINRYKKKCGDYITLSWNALRIDDRIFAIARDVTKEKEIETNLKSKTDMLEMVTDNVPILISYVDNDIRYQYVNNNYYRTYGKTAQDILGKKIEDQVTLCWS